MGDIVELLKYLGITPDKLVPIALVLLVAAFFHWKKVVKPAKREIANVKDAITDLHHATKEVQLHLGKGKFSPQHSLDQKPLFSQYGVSHSPMQPNDNGERLLKASGFYEVYAELKDEIFKKMDRMKLRTAYDYEAGASSALFKLSTEPQMDKLKDYAVNNPNESLELIFGIASWIIRDDYAKYLQQKKKPNK